MQLPENLVSDKEIVDFLNKDQGKHICHVGSTWYSRKGYGHPYRKHDCLRDAVVFCIDNYKSKIQ